MRNQRTAIRYGIMLVLAIMAVRPVAIPQGISYPGCLNGPVCVYARAIDTTNQVYPAILPDGTTATFSGGVYQLSVPSGAGINFAVNEVPSGVTLGSTSLTLAHTPTVNSVSLYRNGVKQQPTADYSISGGTVTLVIAVVSGDSFLADYRY